MKPTPQKHLNAELMGKIVGYNNRSGLLYTMNNGLSQFKPKSNVFPKPVDYSSYSNPSNTKTTLEEMNSKKGSPPNFYSGNQFRLVVPPELQPAPFTIRGGKPQDATHTGGLKMLEDMPE